MEQEQWKDIKGYEGLYQISDHGNVKSFVVDKYQGRLLRQKTTVQGYKAVLLNDRRQVLVHRLVAQAFVPNPNGYKETDHLDNVKFHNHVLNLQWTNSRSNTQKDQADLILCTHESGKRLEVFGTRAASEQTGCWRTSVINSLKSGRPTANGWSFTLIKKSNV